MRHTDPRIPFLAAFESTYQPGHDVDVAETTGHTRLRSPDLDAALSTGITGLRYPLRWHRIEPEPGCFDFHETDAVLGELRDRGADPVVDLVHHTSYPGWLTGGFRDRRFKDSYLRYTAAIAFRYPWLRHYTLFNEPFATLFLAGHEALWPPYDQGLEGFARLLTTVLPAVGEASACWSELLPEARHVWVDTAEHHDGAPGPTREYAQEANDRRHVALDLALGHDLDPERPFLRRLLEAGGEGLLTMPRTKVDVLGLDYYPHSEWWYDDAGGRAPSPHPQGFAAVAGQYAERYGLPMMLSETNVRGLPSDRVTWLRYMLEQYELAVRNGVPLEGFCWFPFVDSCDWDSLLARAAGRADPVGVLSLGPDGARRRTRFTGAWEAAARGAGPADLPAYRFQTPNDTELAGYTAQLADWPWQEPPAGDPQPVRVEAPEAAADLVVLSHLRWVWVWQRPQHLVSRFAAARTAAGARTWFVEEPIADDVSAPVLRTEQHGDVTRVWLVVPHEAGDAPGPRFLDFDAETAGAYAELLTALLGQEGDRDVLLYTPMALDLAESLAPRRLFYDVMDDLASFAGAPAGLVLRQRRALAEAAVVFTGGRSLHRSVSRHRRSGAYLFPSGVETQHYARSRQLRVQHERPVAGYVGVIDERIDLGLVAGLAEALPDWTVRMVGPVTKIDPADLPQAPNLEYPGLTAYEELPAVMAGFDVALLPFALNAATRSISPTKTLEYLAAGLPVVSTRVPDVVADHAEVVHLADDAAGFAACCRQAAGGPDAALERRIRVLTRRHEWDSIAAAMTALMGHPAGATADATAGITDERTGA